MGDAPSNFSVLIADSQRQAGAVVGAGGGGGLLLLLVLRGDEVGQRAQQAVRAEDRAADAAVVPTVQQTCDTNRVTCGVVFHTREVRRELRQRDAPNSASQQPHCVTSLSDCHS